MTDVDHRAEAVRLAHLGEQYVLDNLEIVEAYTHLAQLHIDLAAIAAHTPAGHPVLPYREELAAWREGIEALLDALDGGADSYCRGHRDYLRGLLGSPK